MARRKYYRKRNSVRKAVQRVLASQEELKRHTIVNSAEVDTNGVIIKILRIAQGTAHDERVGDMLNLKSFYLRAQPQLQDVGYNKFRIMLVKSREALASLNQVMENTSNVTFGPINASINYRVIEKVLLDKIVTVKNEWDGAPMQGFFKRYIKHKDKIHYQNELDFAAMENYYLILVSNSSAAPHPTVNLVLNETFTG